VRGLLQADTPAIFVNLIDDKKNSYEIIVPQNVLRLINQTLSRRFILYNIESFQIIF